MRTTDKRSFHLTLGPITVQFLGLIQAYLWPIIAGFPRLIEAQYPSLNLTLLLSGLEATARYYLGSDSLPGRLPL